MLNGTEIRQQLRNQSLEDLLTSSLKTVGNRIYPDDLAIIDMIALQQIVEAWRSTHVQTYGNVLPNSGVIVESIADGGGIEPSNNQVIDITGISCANGGGAAPIEFEVRLGDLPLNGQAIAPSSTVKSTDFGSLLPLTLSKGTALKFVVTSGTSGDFSAKIAYVQRCI